MKKQIKHYLHFYLGCDVRRNYKGMTQTGVLEGVSESEVEYGVRLAIVNTGAEVFSEWDVTETFPVLRPMTEQTPQEGLSVLALNHGRKVEFVGLDERYISYRLDYGKRRSKVKHDFHPVKPLTPEAMRYLITMGFDVFGLIEANLAHETPE